MSETLGEQLRHHQEEESCPMPPEMPEESYAKSCFLETDITSDARIVQTEQAFKALWEDLSKQIKDGEQEPEYELLSGHDATGDKQCLAAAMYQNHEIWQHFIQKCVDNNLNVEVHDYTDDHGFDVTLYFGTSL